MRVFALFGFFYKDFSSLLVTAALLRRHGCFDEVTLSGLMFNGRFFLQQLKNVRNLYFEDVAF